MVEGIQQRASVLWTPLEVSRGKLCFKTIGNTMVCSVAGMVEESYVSKLKITGDIT
jgi:hypothetical protein